MAAIKPRPKITAWSFSRWKDYEQCPFKAYQKHVLKVREPGSPAMERGSTIHKLAENFLKGLLKALPSELKIFGAFFRAFKKLAPGVEQDWAFTRTWGFASWFGADAWCRVKVDAYALVKKPKLVSLRVVDHKTGKPQPDHVDQLSLYAVAGLEKFPEAQQVDSELWYLDHPIQVGGDRPNPVQKTFLREELPALKSEWEKKTLAMLSDTRFAPKPNDKCRFCFFSKAKGGPCQY